VTEDAAFNSPVALAPSPASVRKIVSDSLRGRNIGPMHPGPYRTQEQAALGAAVAILGACLEDDGVGPLPELTTNLVQILLTPGPAT
jgi:hypothetical protein